MSRVSSTGYESSVSSNGEESLSEAIEGLSVTERGAIQSTETKRSGPAKLERYVLDGDVVGDKTVTSQQLVNPKCTPDWQLIKPEHFEKVVTPENWDSDLTKFQERIGVVFKDLTLLKIALTHHGCLHLNVVPDNVPVVRLSNRSFEFLGDSLLGLAAASNLFQMKPWYKEGQLSRAKSALVNNIVLAKVGGELGITDIMLWPPNFTTDYVDDKGRVTIAAGAVESLIAAIYLDQGMDKAMEFMASLILPLSAQYATQDAVWDAVVELQSLLLANNRGHPAYKKIPGNPAFTVELLVQGESILKAESAISYKDAKKIAAEDAYARFKETFTV